jgi:GNAT superfamily N-acetyltransferase
VILAGLGEHFGWIDETANPDLDDISAHYAGALVLVAERAGAIVGTGMLVPEAPSVGRVVRMSVAAPLRRHGLGRRILAALVAAAPGLGYQRIVLETTATWTEVIAFYESFGFHPVEERDGDCHMLLELTPDA